MKDTTAADRSATDGGRAPVVAIIGLGLIGGSLGLALKRPTPGDAGPMVVGWDQDRRAGDRALQRDAIDALAADAADAAARADAVVVAVPVLAVREIFEQIAPALRPGAFVTDVASTKAEVCAWAAASLGNAFIGGHPMAGSERGGIDQARSDLFDGATYCLTPELSTPAHVLQRATRFVQDVGARVVTMSPTAHDRAVAAVSHLPFLLSTSLVDVTMSDPEWEAFRMLAATGFRDVSRLASGDPRMHHDICVTNADAIRPWLLRAARSLEALAAMLDDGDAVLQLFERAKHDRDAFLEETGRLSNMGE